MTPLHFGLLDPEGTILREIANPRRTRDDIAVTYAFCIRQGEWQGEPIDYAAINRAIVERWSLSALRYIKQKAWRRCAI